MKNLMMSIMIVLVIALAACGGQSEEEQPLVGTTWQWVEFQDTADENNVNVSAPENYTLTLNEDGTANIQADCNQVNWTYELDGSSLTFNTLGASTLAFCGEDSLDTTFLERLGSTATYVISDGQLFLNLQADAGNMVFDPQ